MQNLIRLPDVLKRIGVSRSTLYSLCRSGGFPRYVVFHPGKKHRCIAWVESEVDAWIEERMRQRA